MQSITKSTVIWEPLVKISANLAKTCNRDSVFPNLVRPRLAEPAYSKIYLVLNLALRFHLNWFKNWFKSTFTWDPKWTQTGLKTWTALKSRFVYMAISLRAILKSQTAFENCSIHMENSLRQLSKPSLGSIAHVQMISFN